MKQIKRMRQCMLALAPLAACLVYGCGEPADVPDDVLHVEEPIVHGRASTASQNAVVMLRIGEQGLCSGSLVAPNLVLTARHCVSETEPTLLCDPDGHARAGGRVGQDHLPEDIVVFAGATKTSLKARARGAEIVHDGAPNLCDHDIAFVVLDRAVSSVPIAPLRLHDTTRVGEAITAVGWGLTSTGRIPSARMQRADVSVLDVGPSRATAPHHMVVGEAICSGDSGGPALSASGAVIGVVSHGGNGQFDPARPASGCLGPSTRNVYTRVAPFAELVREAFRAAGATPKVEPTGH